MPTYKLTLNLERDGQQVPNYPKVKRLSVDEDQQFAHEKADDGDATTFSALATGELGEIQLLVLEADQQLTLRLDGQSDAGIVLNAGGLLALIGVDMDAGASTNATANNNSGSTANLKGIAGGT